MTELKYIESLHGKYNETDKTTDAYMDVGGRQRREQVVEHTERTEETIMKTLEEVHLKSPCPPWLMKNPATRPQGIKIKTTQTGCRHSCESRNPEKKYWIPHQVRNDRNKVTL